MSKLQSLFEARQFGAGLSAGVIAGLIALVGVAVAASAARRPLGARSVTVRRPKYPSRGCTDDRRPGVIGMTFVVATVAAIGWLGHDDTGARVSVGLVAALIMLWIAGVSTAQLARHRGVIGICAAIPGGLVLATSTPGLTAWTTTLLVVVPAVAGAASADFDERYGGSGAPALAFAAAAFGLYATVPDTELALVTLGAAAPTAMLAWPFTLARIGRGGSYAAVGLLVWVAVVDGAGRAGSTVGAIACLGVLVVEPLARTLARRGRLGTPETIGPAAAIIGVQLVLVAYAARVAGFQTQAWRAVALILPVYALAVGAALTAAGRDSGRPLGPPRSVWPDSPDSPDSSPPDRGEDRTVKLRRIPPVVPRSRRGSQRPP